MYYFSKVIIVILSTIVVFENHLFSQHRLVYKSEHRTSIKHLQFSPDNKLLASIEINDIDFLEIIIRDVKTSLPIVRFEVPYKVDDIGEIAFSKDSKYIAFFENQFILTERNPIFIFDIVYNKTIYNYQLDNTSIPISNIKFENYKLFKRFDDHFTVSFKGYDLREKISDTENHTLTIYEVVKIECHEDYDKFCQSMYALNHPSFSSDSTFFSSIYRGSLCIWNTQNGTLLYQVPPKKWKVFSFYERHNLFLINRNRLIDLSNLNFKDATMDSILGRELHYSNQDNHTYFFYPHPNSVAINCTNSSHIIFNTDKSEKIHFSLNNPINTEVVMSGKRRILNQSQPEKFLSVSANQNSFAAYISPENAIKKQNSIDDVSLNEIINSKREIRISTKPGQVLVFNRLNNKIYDIIAKKDDLINKIALDESGDNLMILSRDFSNFNNSNGYIYMKQDEKYRLLKTIELNKSIHDGVISKNNNRIFLAGMSPLISVYELETAKQIATLNNNGDNVVFMGINNEKGWFISVNDNNVANIWDIKSLELLFEITLHRKSFSVFSNNYYMHSDKELFNNLYVVDKLKIYSIEQFDLKYNRPDIVLDKIGFSSKELIDAYYQAYQKRIKRMGFTEEQLSGEFHVPESAIENFEYMPLIDFEEIELNLNFQDNRFNLDRYNIWINEIPLFGMQGKSLKHLKSNNYSVKETFRLSEGKNKIQVSCLNEVGAESYKETVEINYTPQYPEHQKLYFIGIGVDRYQQPGHDLKYSAKDIRDLVKNLQNKYGTNIRIDTLFDEKVTRENVLALKEKLQKTSVNDKVIISFSGHGLLDSKYDYYLATNTIDFSNPSINGLPYEDLEWLLDSIPARKKLLLLDACHSGEVDKEELIAINDTEKPDGVKGVLRISYKKPELGLKNSFELMQELFANVIKGTGATIISAAGGNQFAYEKSTIANGVFTYSILELMNQQEKVTVGELKEHVGKRVLELTNGQQRPTSRSETLEFDWEIW